MAEPHANGGSERSEAAYSPVSPGPASLKTSSQKGGYNYFKPHNFKVCACVCARVCLCMCVCMCARVRTCVVGYHYLLCLVVCTVPVNTKKVNMHRPFVVPVCSGLLNTPDANVPDRSLATQLNCLHRGSP